MKNRLPNLRNKYPEIEKLAKEYIESASEDIMIQLGETLDSYYVDVRCMADYWQKLLDYLEYNPTFVKLFVKRIMHDINLKMI